MDPVYHDLLDDLPPLGSRSMDTIDSVNFGSPVRPDAPHAVSRTFSAFFRRSDDASAPWRQLAGGLLEPVNDSAVMRIAENVRELLSGSTVEAITNASLFIIIRELVLPLQSAEREELHVGDGGVKVLPDSRIQDWSRFPPGRGLLIERTAVDMALNKQSQGKSSESLLCYTKRKLTGRKSHLGSVIWNDRT